MMHICLTQWFLYDYKFSDRLCEVFTSVLITSAGEFWQGHKLFNDETGKDELGSSRVLTHDSQHVAGNLATFFHSQECTENRTYTIQKFQNLIKTKADRKD